MIIAIASKRGPKVEAVKSFFDANVRHFSQIPNKLEYLNYEVDGGFEMPRSISELMSGAQNRTMQLQKILLEENIKADFLIGMEGGFHSIRHGETILVFLQSWAFVSNGLIGYFGSSGNVLVPDKLAHEVMNNNRDLGVVIDEFANQVNVRSQQGTWGILTKDLLTRKQSFEIALKAAFAPFYNKELY